MGTTAGPAAGENSSCQYRRHDSENNPLSVCNRIIDRFYKNVKDTLEK